MKYLLDTHVLLWLELFPERVNSDVMTILEDTRNSVYVSAISAYEIAQKIRLGKLGVPGFPQTWHVWLRRSKISELPVTSAHALHAASMEWENRDPFDRILIAQATTTAMTLVTADSKILELETLPTLDARF